MDMETMIELVNDAVTDVRVTLLIDNVLDLDERICELDDELVCDDCMKCASRCCMDSMKTCDSCLCC